MEVEVVLYHFAAVSGGGGGGGPRSALSKGRGGGEKVNLVSYRFDKESID